MTTMKQFRMFWAWEDEKEEIWLREMSQKGWHFKSVSLPGNYIFERGEPIDYVYRLDHFINQQDKPGYLQLFEDAGWDYMGEMNRWQYFRQEAIEGEALEIFTDNASKAKKYQRILVFMAILFLPILLGLLGTVKMVNEDDIGIFIQIIAVSISVLLIVYIYAMTRLLSRFNQLMK
jgi:hypothetical protein